MTHDPHDVVNVYTGPLVNVELYQQVLSEAKIESRVVGTALNSAFGGAIPDTIELWVHRSDAEKATVAIERYEQRAVEGRHHHNPHPTNSPKPGAPPPRKEPHTNPDPAGG
jgi:hypothetical protein